MFFQETKRLDIILEKEEKKQPKKCNNCIKVISLILLILVIIIMFIFIIILNNEIKNCQSLINKNTVSDEKKFETIFTKLKEFEEDYISLKKQNKDLKDSISLKDYLIETQYKIINELLFQITEKEKDWEQKDENKELKDLIGKIYYEMKKNNSKELIIQKDENYNEDIKELIRQIIIDIQDEDLKKVIIRQSVEMQV